MEMVMPLSERGKPEGDLVLRESCSVCSQMCCEGTAGAFGHGARIISGVHGQQLSSLGRGCVLRAMCCRAGCCSPFLMLNFTSVISVSHLCPPFMAQGPQKPALTALVVTHVCLSPPGDLEWSLPPRGLGPRSALVKVSHIPSTS